MSTSQFCECPRVDRIMALVVALLLLAVLAPAAHAQDIPDYVASDNLQLIGRLKESGSVAGGKVVGDKLFVTSTSHLSIYDISEAEAPELAGVFTMHIGWENEEVPTNGKILGISNEIGCVPAQNASVDTICLTLYDVSDPANVKWLATTNAIGDHTMACALDCNWFYGSEGNIVDARDPRAPKVAGNWMENLTADWQDSCHHVREISPGIMLGSCQPIVLFSIRPEDGGSPEKPVLLATSDTELQGFIHSSRWPNEGRDRFLLAGGETFVKPTCDEESAKFMTFDGTARPFRLLDTQGPAAGTYVDGRSPYFVFGCSVHWFQEHPAFRDGGVVAVAEFENGTRIKQVTAEGKIVEQGFIVPAGGVAGAPQWHPNGKVFYSTDYERGIDVIRYTGDTYVPPRGPDGSPPAQTPPASRPPGAAAPGSAAARAGRFAFTAKLKRKLRVAALEIRDARGRVVARARLKNRKRLRVSGAALAGRYTWRVKGTKTRGSFRVRAGSIELPAGRTIDLRAR
jgi:hypothetical protein